MKRVRITSVNKSRIIKAFNKYGSEMTQTAIAEKLNLSSATVSTVLTEYFNNKFKQL